MRIWLQTCAENVSFPWQVLILLQLVVNGVTVQTVPRNQSAPGPRPHLPCMGRPDPMAPGPHRPRPDGPQNLDPRGPTDPCTAVPRGAVDPRAMGPRGPFDPRAMAPRPFERRPIPGMPGQEGPGGVGNPQDRPNPVTGRKMHL